MTTEEKSSLEESQEAVEPLQASSPPPEHKQCDHDGDCPQGFRCVDGECVPGAQEVL